MQNIAIIDYGMGNLFSVRKVLASLGVHVIITNDPEKILAADKLILPGVGHFGKAMENLKRLNLIETLNTAVLQNKTPILGICLGMQLMAKRGEEGDTEGFGWFDAEVVKFNVKDQLRFKVPHVGWNCVEVNMLSKLMSNIDDTAEFYFVHSYYMKLNDPAETLNTTVYEEAFTSAIEKGNIFGVQYHPEKSHDVGEMLLANFVHL